MQTPTKIDFSAMHALIAMSNYQLGRTVWHFLRDEGVGSCMMVTNTQDAVSRMHTNRFNLFFVDYDLPEFGGVDFVKFLRLCDGPISEAFVVIVIPSPDKDKVMAARDGGAHEILGLPLTAKLMNTRLYHMVENPKPFIRCPSYIGPCRRREVVTIYHGTERRKQSGNIVSA